jgi:hypothetical protein
MNTSGAENTVLGANAMEGQTTGNKNTAIGRFAGNSKTTGDGNVFLGYNTGPTVAGAVNNALYIDNSANNTPLIYGDFSGNTLTFNGAITTTGTSALNGHVTVGGGATSSELRLLEPSADGSNYTAFKAQAQGTNVTYTLPAAAGTTGQVVKIASLSGTNATFEWTTPAASSTGTSARLAADAVDATSWSTGPLIAVGNSKKYRVVGEFAIKRGTSGSEDDFQIRIASPDNGTYVACAIECLDCPATTTGVPQYKEDTGTNVDFTVIDPDGNMEGTVYHYRIEGIFKTDADGAGNVRLTFNKNGGAPTTTMMANSHWALIEIN